MYYVTVNWQISNKNFQNYVYIFDTNLPCTNSILYNHFRQKYPESCPNLQILSSLAPYTDWLCCSTDIGEWITAPDLVSLGHAAVYVGIEF